MLKKVLSGVCAAGLLMVPSVASAGPDGDGLAACFNRSANVEDQIVLVRWIFSAIAYHPGVADMARVTPEERVSIDRKSGELVTRLLTQDCRAETAAALRSDGPEALETAFGSLGETAMQSLMQNPDVAKGLTGMASYLNEDELLRAFVGAPEKK